jgi:hypothetical protein
MDQEALSTGVSFDRLKLWLGEPLIDEPTTGESVAVTMTVTTPGGSGREVERSHAQTARWDCLHYEPTFRAILESTSRAPDTDREFVTHVLHSASSVHMLTGCHAERKDNGKWVISHLCVKHLWQ